MKYKQIYSTPRFDVEINTNTEDLNRFVQKGMHNLLKFHLPALYVGQEKYIYTLNILQQTFDCNSPPSHSYEYELEASEQATKVFVELRDKLAIVNLGLSLQSFDDSSYDHLVLNPLKLLLLKDQFVFFHGAWVSSDKSNIFLLGRSGQGKSSVSAALCQDGYKFFSDDQLFVRTRNTINEYTCLPVKMGIRYPDADIWKDLPSTSQDSDMFRGKKRIIPNKQWLTNGGDMIDDKKTLLIFLKHTHCSQQPSLNEINFDQALQQLVGDSYIRYEQTGYDYNKDDVFFTLYSVLKQNPYIELTYNYEYLSEIATVVKQWEVSNEHG